jgi:hypothetical protein
MLSNVRSFLVRSLLTLLALNTLAQSTAVDTGNFDPQFTKLEVRNYDDEELD